MANTVMQILSFDAVLVSVIRREIEVGSVYYDFL